MNLGGCRYVTGAEIAQVWPDVTADLLRDWVRRRLLTPLTVGRLADLTGRPVPAGWDPAAPARMPSPAGPVNLYRWDDVVDLELAMRRSARGRTRKPPA